MELEYMDLPSIMVHASFSDNAVVVLPQKTARNVGRSPTLGCNEKA